MSFRNRVRADLGEIASRAEISESAWDDICARIDADLSDRKPDIAVHDLRGTGRRRPRRTMVAVAAAAITMVAGAFAFNSWLGDDGGRIDTAVDQTTETSGDAVTAVVTDYIDAVNRGDVEDAMAQFDRDATITGRHRSIRNSEGRASLRQWASRLAWLVGQEATITDVRCDTSAASGDGSTAACTWRLNDAVSHLVEQPGSVSSISLTVADGEIVSYDETFDWSEGQAMFTIWLQLNHPEQAMIDPFDWYFDLSIEPARGFGADYAEFARAWLDVCSEASSPTASEGAAPTGAPDMEGSCFQRE